VEVVVVVDCGKGLASGFAGAALESVLPEAGGAFSFASSLHTTLCEGQSVFWQSLLQYLTDLQRTHVMSGLSVAEQLVQILGASKAGNGR
jgi:hypothetical protein